jgi:cardiolipin synthase C
MKALATWTRCAATTVVVVLASCATLPAPIARAPEVAFAAPDTTALGKMATTGAHAGDVSGFRLLESGDDAFAALVGLVERAQRSLDLEYYLVRDDLSSRRLLREVAAAAARGVKVRLLVDDFNTAGEEDVLLCVAKQANVEVQLYNPFPAGRFSTASRLIGSASNMQRIGARMHNKLLIADSAVAVTGGRNLGDAYFVQSTQANFLDLDLLVAGPVVRGLAASFDSFWNNKLAYPVQTLIQRTPACNGAEPAREVAANAEKAPATASSAAPAKPGPTKSLAQGKLDLTWAPVKLLADKPTKTTSDGQPAPNETMSDDVERLLKAAQREVLVISPYFVPGPYGMEVFDALRRRGVTVRILTNSLAATDAPAVHTGYARYRQPLLEAGAALYELRPQLGSPRSGVGDFGSSHSSLHAKAPVIDRRVVLVGSMNMDPRSANLNSEMGLVLHSPHIAVQLADLFSDVTAHSSYAVTLKDGYHLHWTTQDGDRKVEYDDEPEVSAARRMMLWFVAPFAPEAML